MDQEKRMSDSQLEASRMVLEGQIRIAEERIAVLSAEYQRIAAEQMKRMANGTPPR